MTQHEHPFHYYRSPVEIREVQFTHRVRGVDEYEVAEFLDLLADQVHATDLEMERLREERDRLRHDNEALRAEMSRVPAHQPSPARSEATPQAAALIMNAQRVADDLVEEAVRRTRDMLTMARAEKNAILRNAQEAAAAMMLEARDKQGMHISSHDTTGVHRSTHETSVTLPPRDPAPAVGVHMAQHQRRWQLDGTAV